MENVSVTTYISEAQRHLVKSLSWHNRHREIPSIFDITAENMALYRADDLLTPLKTLFKKDNDHLLAFTGSAYEEETFLAWESDVIDYISNPALLLTKHDEKSLFAKLRVQNTPKGIWQALILRDLWCIALPLSGHGNYNRIAYVLDESDLRRFPLEYGMLPFPLTMSVDFDPETMLPSVTRIDESTWMIRLCIWSDWMGLVQTEIKVKCRAGNIRFYKPKTKTLYRFNCGILF